MTFLFPKFSSLVLRIGLILSNFPRSYVLLRCYPHGCVCNPTQILDLPLQQGPLFLILMPSGQCWAFPNLMLQLPGLVSCCVLYLQNDGAGLISNSLPFFFRLWVSPWILFRKIESQYQIGINPKELGDQEP